MHPYTHLFMRGLAELAIATTSITGIPAHANTPTVAIDVGHQPGRGARAASGTTEFVFNQRFADRLARELLAAKVPVKRIPVGLPLAQRVAAAEGAALLISIHHDSVQPRYRARASDFSGYSLFVSRHQQQATYPVGLACARQVSTYLAATGRRHSEHHAVAIAGEGRPWADKALGIHEFDDLIVLHSSPVPALLLEVAVIANANEERLARDPKWIAAQARSVAQAAVKCLATTRVP